MRFILPVCLWALVGSPSPEPAPKLKAEATPEVASIEGYYHVAGSLGTGKEYSGVVTIRQPENAEVYFVQWSVQPGAVTLGIAFRQDDRLVVGWIEGEKGRGVSSYRIESGKRGPRLVGRWASLPGSGQVNAESLEFLRGLD